MARGFVVQGIHVVRVKAVALEAQFVAVTGRAVRLVSYLSGLNKYLFSNPR